MARNVEAGSGTRRKNDFCEVVNSCRMVDAGYSGDKFTWVKNKRDRNSTKERLDRYLINLDLKQSLKSYKVEHSLVHSSDHKPIIMSLSWDNDTKVRNRKRKIVRFEESWLHLEECKEVLRQSWGHQEATSPQNFSRKIQASLKAMKRWNTERLNG